MIPALLTRISNCPNLSAVVSTTFFQSSSFETSCLTNSALSPNSLAYCSPFSALISVITTLALSSTNNLACDAVDLIMSDIDESIQLDLMMGADQSIKSINTTNIIVDGKQTDMSISELFDNKKFSHFAGVTYSCSPKFINKYLNAFDTLKIVIGINEDTLQTANGNVLSQMQLKRQLIDIVNDTMPKMMSSLSSEAINRLSNDEIELLVPTTSFTIHSKFYLLWNDDITQTRVIFGSANLSDTAFNSNIRQFEDVLVFDNSDYFNLYQTRFNNIRRVTVPWIPKSIIKKNNFNKKSILEDDEISDAIVLSPNDLTKIKKEALVSKLEDLNNKEISLGLVPGIVPDELTEINQNQKNNREALTKAAQAERILYDLAYASVNNRKAEPTLKSKTSIAKSIDTHVKFIVLGLE